MLIVVALLAVIVVAGVALTRRAAGTGDAQARIANAAANRLPTHLHDWGRAMVAELTNVHGRARRWRFAIGILRVALFPPLRAPGRVLVVAAVAVVVAGTAAMAAAVAVPNLSVFVAILAVLLVGYAAVASARAPQPRPSALQLVVGVVALAGLAATIVAVVRIGAAHPAATADRTHVFSILFALALAGYLAVALTPIRLGQHTNRVLWWALAAALAAGTAWAVIALVSPPTADGAIAFLSPVGAVATLAAAIGASATTRSDRAGVRAGLLTIALAAPIQVAVALTAVLHQRFILTDPYDIAAYPHSGYPDVASYLLSDTIGGEIITGLVLYPVTLLVFALVGAGAGSRLKRRAAG
jgi:hypothetical protein